jgi:hypothetical protein
MIGQIVYQQRILEKLGGGGMGAVYEAEDARPRCPVALKFLPERFFGAPTSLDLFDREAKAASAITPTSAPRQGAGRARMPEKSRGVRYQHASEPRAGPKRRRREAPVTVSAAVAASAGRCCHSGRWRRGR